MTHAASPELRSMQRGRVRKILILRNTVAGAVDVRRELETLCGADTSLLFMVNGTVTLHQRRFAREDRRLLDCSWRRSSARRRPRAGWCSPDPNAGAKPRYLRDFGAELARFLPAGSVLLQRIGGCAGYSAAAGAIGAPARINCHGTPRCLAVDASGRVGVLSRPAAARRQVPARAWRLCVSRFDNT